MPRASVTQELVDTIKYLRIKNNIPSFKLAEHINKSPAYISRLEKGEIHTVDISLLSSILHFITKEESDTKTAEQIFTTLQARYTPQEIDEQLWFLNFDTIERNLPIPSELIDTLNSRLKTHNISRSYLLNRINANEALTPEELDALSSTQNIWCTSGNDEFKKNIRIVLTADYLDSILEKEKSTSPYMFVFCIAFYILKIAKFSELIEISNDEYRELYDETTALLNSFKFYSISERNNIYGNEVHKINKEIADLLSSYGKESSLYFSDILKQFMIASDIDIKRANDQLKQFSQNLHWDLGFMLILISSNFSSLENISIKNRKELLNEIKQLICKYKEMPSQQNIIEDY